MTGDRVVIDVHGVGYEASLPHFVMLTVQDRNEGESLELEIYYHVTDRQLRPTLIGFNNETERRFFEKFISVEDIGPQKAARALTMSVSTIARAIEAEDIGVLRRLPGIGERTARKMVATLRGKVTEEALLQDAGFTEDAPTTASRGQIRDIRDAVIDIFVSQLGYRRSEATSKVDAAIQRSPTVTTEQELIQEVYRGEMDAR
ncbi:MAG: Holliday junction branch migration protein RuvA [Chloroflexota bacterium]